MLIEMHAHTKSHSACSHIDPVELVRQARKKGLQGIILTEHHYLWGEDELAELKRRSEAEDYFVLLAAQEVDTDAGHVLVYGADRSIEEKVSLDELRRLYPDAALVWAHPLRDGRIPAEERLKDPRFDAIEIFSSNHTQLENYHGLSLWHRYKFTAISGSDTHAVETAGILPSQFDHPVSTIEDVVKELKSGRCRPFYKEIPRAGSTIVVNEIIFGTKGDDESRSRIILKTPARPSRWRSIKRSSKISQLLYDKGFARGAYRVPRMLDIDDDEQLVIEEGQRGKSLFDLMIQVSPSIGRRYFTLAAMWLAQLHAKRIRLKAAADAKKREEKRFASYLGAFSDTDNPYMHEVQRLITAVETAEDRIFSSGTDSFVLIHGDYHPKNIIIGQDRMHDVSTLYISVIDFAGAMLFHRAFDVGYFIAQFYNQFREYPHVIDQYRKEDFIQTYLEHYGEDDPRAFNRAVNLFQIRANLSIGAYLIKVGKGTSENMDQIISQSVTLLDEMER